MPKQNTSKGATLLRLRAVRLVGCPTCKAAQGVSCLAKGGGRYDPRYFVHTNRIHLAGPTDDR